MSVIILLIIIGILVAGAFLIGFIWAVKSGQYDDTFSPSVRILFDDPAAIKKKRTSMMRTNPNIQKTYPKQNQKTIIH